MVDIDSKNNCLAILSQHDTSHRCEICKHSNGYFTSCLDTVKTKNSDDFSQAYGYFEIVCKVPDSPGMWAAFWLQCGGTNNIGFNGRDGSEIDIFESSFHQKNRTSSGSALHFDSYIEPFHKCISHICLSVYIFLT